MTKTKKSTSSIKLPDGNLRKAIIGSLLSDPKTCNWGLEMRMMNCLLKQHNDPEFWFFLSRRYKFLSLKNLITQKSVIFSIHLEYIKQKSLNLLPVNPLAIISEEKKGEDAIIPERQKTLLEFIKENEQHKNSSSEGTENSSYAADASYSVPQGA